MKTKNIDIWWLIRINVTCSLLVWLISRFNLFLISKELNGLIYLIPSALIYMLIIFVVAYVFRNNIRLSTLVFGIVIAIYTINLGLLSNLIFPLCNGNLDLTTKYALLFLLVIVFISFLTIKLNYKLKKSYKWVILFAIFGLIHFIAISMTYYLNYINLYEYVFSSLF